MAEEQDKQQTEDEAVLVSALQSKDAIIIDVTDGDVYSNYKWGINSSKQQYINDVPTIRMTEIQPTNSNLLEDLKLTANIAGQTIFEPFKNTINAVKDGKGQETSAGTPYLNMYDGVPTGNTFIFPFFSDYHHELSHSYGDSDALGDTITKKIRLGTEILHSLSQKGHVEKRRIYQGSDQAQYSFTFSLYNTFGSSAEIGGDIFKNFELIRALLNNNMPDRTSFATILPPCFYIVDIAGTRYSPVSAIQGISVVNIGQMNRRKVLLPQVGRLDRKANELESVFMNIPDAWQVTISIVELMPESRDIFNSTFSSQKVEVIKDVRDFKQGVKQSSDKLTKFADTRGMFG